MNNPSADLVTLKKICVELQRELAYAVPDADAVALLADEAKYLADSISAWARKQ